MGKSTYSRVLKVDANFRSVAGKVQLRAMAGRELDSDLGPVRYTVAVEEGRKEGRGSCPLEHIPRELFLGSTYLLWGSNNGIIGR